MAFLIGSTTVANTNGFFYTKFTSTGRPSSPTQGQIIYNTSTNQIEIYDGANWRLAVNERSYFHRQVITTSYVMGGYKDTVVWRNVNRMVHATDVMTNLGDQLDTGAAYTSGVCSLTYGYLWGCTAAWPGTSSTTNAFNMATETNAGSSATWNLRNARNDCGTIFKEHQYAYIIAGGTADVDIFNLMTETMLSTDPGPNTNLAGSNEMSGVGTLSGEDVGYAWSSSAAKDKLTFATMTSYTVAAGAIYGAHDQQKGINSKLNRGWCGGDGSYSGGYILNRWNFTTETTLGSAVSKPIGNSGEENLDMGQFFQYMMGMYDGAQNNRGWKFTYSTESGVELGSGSVRTGPAGGSSGHCVWKG
jgi:hypothetical protein